jgi:hypothetical protein
LGIRWRQRPHKAGASTKIRADPRLGRGCEGHGDRGGEGYLGEEGGAEEGGGDGGGEGGGDCVQGAHLHLSLPALKLDLLQVCCEGVWRVGGRGGVQTGGGGGGEGGREGGRGWEGGKGGGGGREKESGGGGLSASRPTPNP